MTDTVTALSKPFWKRYSWYHPWWILFLWGLLTVIIGILFLAQPGITTLVFVTFIGAFWLVGGIFSLAGLVIDRTHWGWKVFLAALNLIAGILVLLYPLYSTFFLLLLFVAIVGVWALFIGLAHLYHAFAFRDAGNGILGIMSLIFGLLLLLFPYISAILVPYVAGIFAVVTGIITLVVSFKIKENALLLFKVAAMPSEEDKE